MDNFYRLLMVRSYPEEQLRMLRRKRRINALKSASLGLFSILGAFILLNHFSKSLEMGLNLQFLSILTILALSIVFFGLMFHYLNPSENERKFTIGVEGEKVFKKYLNKIEGYKFYSLPLPHGGDIDALLINPKGIFAFEVKNYSGIIKCVGDEWKRIKIGKGGGRYEGHVGNPSYEAKKHALDLQDYLNMLGFKVLVYPVVVITHPKAQLQCDRCSIKVIKPEDIKVLLHKKNELTDKECKRIYKEISKLI